MDTVHCLKGSAAYRCTMPACVPAAMRPSPAQPHPVTLQPVILFGGLWSSAWSCLTEPADECACPAIFHAARQRPASAQETVSTAVRHGFSACESYPSAGSFCAVAHGVPEVTRQVKPGCALLANFRKPALPSFCASPGGALRSHREMLHAWQGADHAGLSP